MDIMKELISFREAGKDSWDTVDKENLFFFVTFLNTGVYQKIPKNYPYLKYLEVKISFKDDGSAVVEYGADPIKLDTAVPFTKEFMWYIATELYKLQGTDNTIGISASISEDRNSFVFIIDTTYSKYYFFLNQWCGAPIASINWAEASLLATFLSTRSFKRILREYPCSAEVKTKISFAPGTRPKMTLSDFMTLEGDLIIPFTREFVLSATKGIKNLHDSEYDIGISATISDDETEFTFRATMP